MSVFREREVACGGCGTRTVQAVALSVHGSRAPALLDEIRAGTFHRFTCPACGAATLVEGPFLVIDFERAWWVQVYPRRWVDAWRALELDARRRFEQALAENAPDEVRALAPAFERRLTFGLDGLREKLLLRDAGLRDELVETYKLLALARLAEPPALLRVCEVSGPAVHLVGADQGVLAVTRATLAEIEADATLEPTRARLLEGAFVDAQRLFVPGHAPSPLAA